MKASVIRLCDVDKIAIPPELLKVELDEKMLTDAVARLGLRYAAEAVAEIVEMGDTVHCRPDASRYPDGRDILLYTDVALPGAEQAAQAAIGRRVGDGFEAVIAGKSVQLTVSKIVRRVPAEVNDALIASMALDGVSTVAEYTAYIRAKMLGDMRVERSKEITHLLVDKMTEDSEFDYNAAELEKMIDEEIELFSADYAEDSLDMTPAEMRSAIAAQIKQGWVARAFCESHGIEIDRAGAEQYTDQMLHMTMLMGEETPTREEVLEMALQNEYYRGFYEYIDKLIERKMGA